MQEAAILEDQQAVSPVIAVILMVAITVVLAAVVFVLVTKLSATQRETTPSVSFSTDRGTRSVTVLQADVQTSYSNLKATVVCSAGTPSLTRNGSAVALGSGIADPVAATGFISANDVFVPSCSTSTAGTSVTLSLVWKPTNSALGNPFAFTY